MTDRVNEYYQLPASTGLIQHFRHNIGLKGVYLDIFDDLRNVRGGSQLHADNLQLPLKKYNDKAAIVSQKCLWELVRLAEIGLKAESESRPKTD